MAITAKAKKLQRQCGTWSTARYLRRQGYPIEVALLLLAGRS